MNGNDKDALRSSPSAALGIGEALINRKRLLVSLLSDREAVRVICAPPLYGKTVLANQYARMAFSSRKRHLGAGIRARISRKP